MRKLAIAAICAALALALTGCAVKETVVSEGGNLTIEPMPTENGTTRITASCEGINGVILTDMKTGVQYMVVTRHPYSVAITPLLNADGTPYVEVE